MHVLELTDRLWRGEERVEDHHPLHRFGGIEEVADGIGWVSVMSNVVALATAEGLVLVDSGGPFSAEHVHREVRSWSAAPVEAVVFSHGHVDHVLGVGPFDEEARAAGAAAPTVVAHEAVEARFARYRLTAGWNGIVNARQFGLDELEWPTEYRTPDRTYRDRLDVDVGGERFELHHARGETDDHTWTWIPGRRVLCCGDLFIWASPNAGNPQKVQRYPAEWATALRTMAALGAELLLPGHGVPVAGPDRVRQALTDTADLLDSLHDQTVRMMNGGADLDEILHTVQPPAHLLDRPYLRPVYDDPEFVVRNVWRLYGGWWDGDPASLKPARAADLARELAALSGGAERLAARARDLLAAGDLRLAGHLAQLALRAAPDHAAVRAIHAEVFERRAAAEPSSMAQGIFRAAARRYPASPPKDRVV